MILVFSLLFMIIFIIVAITFSRQLIKKEKKFIPTHKVKLLTNTVGLSLRKEPNSNFEVFMKIENGTEIQHIFTGENVMMGEINGYWFEIRTKENIYGWCFSGSLEKI